jgi:hypothetical protein
VQYRPPQGAADHALDDALGIIVILIMVAIGLVLLGLMFGGGGGGGTTIRGSSRSSIYRGEIFTFRTRR